MKRAMQRTEGEPQRNGAVDHPRASNETARAQNVVSLLTGGSDRPYVYGLTHALLAEGYSIEMIGSDELDFPEFRNHSSVRFLNLRGSCRSDVSAVKKATRILLYYARLILYAAAARPKVFHILWNNKFETFDRTALMLYYRSLGKRLVLTAHNVNAAKRDLNDSYLNRLTLRIQYKLAHQIFVHTDKMKQELADKYGISDGRVTVIPFGINNAVPHTALTTAEAKLRLGLGKNERSILLFGRITPYKGLDYLIPAFRDLLARYAGYRLIIAGRPDRCEEYWKRIQDEIRVGIAQGKVLVKDGFIPDEEVEVYFKAADVLVLPYRDVYQSGVLFLGQSFGLPVIAADVGSLKDDIIERENGFVFEAENIDGLGKAIEKYFASDIYSDLDRARGRIQSGAAARHSWTVVGRTTVNLYSRFIQRRQGKQLACETSNGSLDADAR